MDKWFRRRGSGTHSQTSTGSPAGASSLEHFESIDSITLAAAAEEDQLALAIALSRSASEAKQVVNRTNRCLPSMSVIACSRCKGCVWVGGGGGGNSTPCFAPHLAVLRDAMRVAVKRPVMLLQHSVRKGFAICSTPTTFALYHWSRNCSGCCVTGVR
jgi:hypothetical protein